MLALLFLLIPLGFVWAGWPIVAKVDTYVGDTFYRVQREYRLINEKTVIKKIKTLSYTYIESVIPKDWLRKLDHILTLAGVSNKYSALDVLLFQGTVVAGMGFLDVWAKKTSPILLLFLTVAVVTTPWRRFGANIQKRRLSAAEQIRGIKRRFVTLLRRGTVLEEALWQIARESSGDFGVVFRRRMQESRTRPLSEALNDLQREFKVAELTRFVQAVRAADANSVHGLADIIEKQAREEAARMDDFIQKRKAVVQNRMRMFAALSFLYMLAFGGYFTWQILSQYFLSHTLIGL